MLALLVLVLALAVGLANSVALVVMAWRSRRARDELAAAMESAATGVLRYGDPIEIVATPAGSSDPEGRA